jgi:hypothetical protein
MGRLRSRRWRVVVATSVAGSMMALVGGSLIPGPLSDTPIDNPFGLAGVATTMAKVVANTGVVVHTASLPSALVCLVLRFRASRGSSVSSCAGSPPAPPVPWLGCWPGRPAANTVISGVLYSTVLGVPVAVAVLRYRLWDLDRLVSRTVTYAVVTALLLVPYLLVVPAAGRLAQGSGSLAVAGVSLAAAAAFAPCAAGSKTWSTGASTEPAMTLPAPWKGSLPTCATRSTWMRSAPSCWPWSTRPCSRWGCRCGCAPRQTQDCRGSHSRRRHASRCW